MLSRLIDLLAAAVMTVGAPLSWTITNWSGNYPLYLRQAERFGVIVKKSLIASRID